METKKTNILIVGAGRGGSLLIELLHKSEKVNIIGVVDINADARGIKLAKELGIPTDSDYKEFLNRGELNEVINVTGVKKVQEDLLRRKPSHVEVIGGYSAKLIWDLIVEREQMEEAIQESEKKYRNLVDNALVGIFKSTLKGDLIYVNEYLSTMLGFESPQEMMAEGTPTRYKNPKDREVLIENLRREYKVKNFDVELLTKTGKTVNALMNANLEGDVITGMIMDITERKRAEEELGAEKNKLQAMIDAMEYGISIRDLDYNIIYQNEVLRNFFGDRLGEKCYQAYEGKDKICDGCPVEMAYKNGKSHTYERKIKMPSGEIAFWENTANPIRDTRGKIVSCLEIARNITERKRAEKALRESEQKYRALFEESKDVIYMSTPEGKFLDINSAGIELFGYPSKEEILRIDITNDLYANPDDREKFQQVLARQGYVKDYEVVFKRRDGEHIIVLLTSAAVPDEKGKIIAYRGIMKDITERKRLEQQLLQAQKMEAIGQLAGGIAHDFNNILTAIIGFGTLLKIETSKDDLLRSYVTQILTSAERAANLTQALLAFSRRQIISPKPMNLNEIIQGVERLLSRLIGEDIELSTFLTDKELTVMADSGQIETVLMNLATNARDAMPDGGSLIIKTELTEFNHEFIKAHGYDRPGFYALISVEDTGHGMDEKTKARIFEPFFTTKEVGKGTGLGLSMVYGIVKQHDGYINLYSEPGMGSTFKIYLPLIKSKVEEAELAARPVLKRGTETVIAAEDDSQVRELIKEVLEGFGYKVMEAADGEDALRVFNENKDRVQLLVLDVVMPKKNGKEVYDEIRKVRPDIKAIFTSGYNADIIHQKGILEEGLDFISKPISPEELLRKVREILDK
jgi:two-component system cell cycle sensor histidine kinase/response regulator CckA